MLNVQTAFKLSCTLPHPSLTEGQEPGTSVHAPTSIKDASSCSKKHPQPPTVQLHSHQGSLLNCILGTYVPISFGDASLYFRQSSLTTTHPGRNKQGMVHVGGKPVFVLKPQQSFGGRAYLFYSDLQQAWFVRAPLPFGR